MKSTQPIIVVLHGQQKQQDGRIVRQWSAAHIGMAVSQNPPTKLTL
jgi:hypothetical protein